MSAPPRIIVTCGDPAGIGPDIALKTAIGGARIVLIGDREMLIARAKLLGLSPRFIDYDGRPPPAGALPLLHLPCNTAVTAGRLDAANSAHVIECIERAADLCMAGEFDAMVTGPVNKAVINRAGIRFRGHTEWIAERCGAPAPVMMLAGGGMRVCLLTTHLPLREVHRHITAPRIEQTAGVILDELRRLFHISAPALGVCGLNPHAGEDGYLGMEEIEIIAPALRRLRARGRNIIGPLPADTAFTAPRLAQFDAVLAMYHDQALPVVKHANFGGTVNITLGLPIIRTSVDHGTAAELAGGDGPAAAGPSSLRAAV
ncbi:MAG: 4-hydroxythreonine-4-phosphate dehydrogenase PdxA, partial [Gammaproteobacteria bacterium]